jgi:hypothetical protein
MMDRPQPINITGNGFRRPWLAASLCLVCWGGFLLFFTGCGKKAPPVAPQPRPLAAVTDLKAMLDQGHVRLTWTHSPENRYAKSYVVLRAQRGLSQPECSDCPKVFQKVGMLPLAGALRDEKHALDFSQNLATGFRYIFSVRPIHSSGAQGPDSNFVVVDVPVTGEGAKDARE